MLGLRLTSEVQKRWKKGRPPHSTTGVDSTNSSQGMLIGLLLKRNAAMNACGHSMLPIAIASNGTVSATLTQNLRVMSRSSGFASAAVVTVRGSKAMPQIGHEPGSGRTISGCMGQVYSVRVAATGFSGSRAMPQDGHAARLASRTSGHI